MTCYIRYQISMSSLSEVQQEVNGHSYFEKIWYFLLSYSHEVSLMDSEIHQCNCQPIVYEPQTQIIFFVAMPAKVYKVWSNFPLDSLFGHISFIMYWIFKIIHNFCKNIFQKFGWFFWFFFTNFLSGCLTSIKDIRTCTGDKQAHVITCWSVVNTYGASHNDFIKQ